MKKAQAAKAASQKKRLRASEAAKQSGPQSTRTRSLSRQSVGARTKADQDGRVVTALTSLVEISVEIRELLAEIRDALVEGEETEPERVDNVVIAETEGPEPPDDDL